MLTWMLNKFLYCEVPEHNRAGQCPAGYRIKGHTADECRDWYCWVYNGGTDKPVHG